MSSSGKRRKTDNNKKKKEAEKRTDEKEATKREQRKVSKALVYFSRRLSSIGEYIFQVLFLTFDKVHSQTPPWKRIFDVYVRGGENETSQVVKRDEL